MLLLYCHFAFEVRQIMLLAKYTNSDKHSLIDSLQFFTFALGFVGFGMAKKKHLSYGWTAIIEQSLFTGLAYHHRFLLNTVAAFCAIQPAKGDFNCFRFSRVQFASLCSLCTMILTRLSSAITSASNNQYVPLPLITL